MSLTKVFVMAALAAGLIAGFISAAPALAISTQLCKVHTQLTCPANQGTVEDHQVLEPGTVWTLLNTLADILCDEALKRSSSLGLGNPQIIHTLELVLTHCGTDANHNNCVITAEELPLLRLLKTGLDQGVLTATNGKLRVKCTNVGPFKFSLDCTYDLTGMELSMGNQHSTAFQVPLRLIAGGFPCPDEVFEDQLLVTTANHFILG